jgi:hypothetical protein
MLVIRASIFTLSMQGWTDRLILRLVFWDVMLCKWVDRYIWKELAASIFWVEELAVQGTNDMDTGRHKQKQKLWEPAGTRSAQIATVLVPGFLPYMNFLQLSDYFTWKMEAAYYFKYVVPFYQSGVTLCANLKSYAFHWYVNPDNGVNNAKWNGTSHHHQ